jgi:hypothetical protein
VTVREGLLRDEGVAAVVLKRVSKRCRFGCTLSCVEVACRLNNLSELLVRMG